MTLDVTIGKVVIEPYDPEYKDEDGACVAQFSVEPCPELDYDLCISPGCTLWPREAYRSGSLNFWDFFLKKIPGVYRKLRYNPTTNDRDVAWIKPIIDEINRLSDDIGTDIDNDRMKWFKFWCNRAVELYGENAGIEFS